VVDAGPALSGVLLAASCLPFDLSVLAWFALVPLAITIKSPNMGRAAYGWAYVGGMACHLPWMYWITSTSGRVDLSTGLWATCIGASMLGGALLAVPLAVGRRFVAVTKLPMMGALPMLWVMFEIARYYIGAIIDQTGFPWLRLGATQTQWPEFIQIADLGGEYLLSFVVAVVNGFWVDSVFWCREFQRRQAVRRMLVATAALVVIAMGIGVYGQWRLGQSVARTGPDVCLMGGIDLPPLIDRRRLTGSGNECSTGSPFRTVSHQPAGDRFPELLIWPEMAYHHHVFASADRQPLTNDSVANGTISQTEFSKQALGLKYLEETATELGVSMLMGCRRVEPGSNGAEGFNSLVLVNPESGYSGAYDKHCLVPWAEFLPFGMVLVDVDRSTHYEHGSRSRSLGLRVVESGQDYRVGCLICYDVCFSDFVLRSAGQGTASPDFFVQCGDEPVYSRDLQRAMFRMTRLRAIENRRAIVRNATNGVSGIVDGCGRHIVTAPRIVSDPYRVGRVPLDRRFSLYARWGDWLPWVCACGVAIGLIRVRRRTRTHQG